MSQLKSSEILSELFESVYHKRPIIEPIKGGGSSRSYFRLKDNDLSVVGVFSEDKAENEAFLKLDKCFRECGINVPYIIKVSANGNAYLLEDLGDTLLIELLSGDQKIRFAREALENLIEIQNVPMAKWEGFVLNKSFSERLVSWDLNYFKYCFLKTVGLIFNEESLQNDFDRLTEELTKSNNLTGFMYRDFQSRNIMVKNGKLWFIDFQGGRKGPVIYDLVSFLWQAKAPFSFEERKELAEYYMNMMSEMRSYPIEKLRKELNPMIIFRTLQVLGAYGLRGLIEKKAHFIESLPLAIKNLWNLRETGILDNYPELKSISETLRGLNLPINKREVNGLTVSVYSFSYKKGYPNDYSGNGGGFIFDCRGIHNPGRYDEFKSLTGMDDPVKDFLNKDGEAPRFVEDAVNLVLPTIRSYLRRGFNSLLVGFGCTGGQHRSVYCAEEFANEIKRAFTEVEVRIEHREMGIVKEI